jgi:hypothetical protein
MPQEEVSVPAGGVGPRRTPGTLSQEEIDAAIHRAARVVALAEAPAAERESRA